LVETEPFFLHDAGRPMSDSEGEKELSGIARSVDALFENGSASDDPESDAPEADTGLSEGVREEEPVGSVDAPPPLPDLGASSEDDAEASTAEADTATQDAATGAGDRAFEPAPLDLAIDAYLAGDTEKAQEIEALASEMLESRRLDPVAGALGRLAIAAGDPPDEDILEVARAIGTPMVYGRLAGRIGAEREETRLQEYFLACRNLANPMAVAIREHLADSTDRHARRVHCDALVEMGDAGRRMIEQMVEDENRFLVRNAVAILGDTGGERAVELVTTALANPDARVRREALRSLAKLGDEPSGELVLGSLEDSDPEVRIQAAVTAGELHVERALRSIIKLLDDADDPDEIVPLIRALGHLGDPGAVPSIEKHAVTKLFSKPPVQVRIVAYRALHQIGTPHARRLLNQAVDDKDPEVRAAVKEILGLG
jgi:HEAT repeat protein